MAAVLTALSSLNRDDGFVEINPRPRKLDQLLSPEPVAVGQPDHGGVTKPPSPLFGASQQLGDLTLKEMLTLAVDLFPCGQSGYWRLSTVGFSIPGATKYRSGFAMCFSAPLIKLLGKRHIADCSPIENQ